VDYASEIDRYGIDDYLSRYRDRDMLRLLTCGSVDDGKSTLIGRLLHDTQMVFDDVLSAIKKDTEKYGTTGEEVDFALLVDGLQAEREQGITIDVAYRYFATEKRKFVIADTPGHVQYTRNMATGASTCDLAVILIDARHGVLEQTRRHSFIATLLGVQHLVVAVNKMDLVDWSEERFEEIRKEYNEFAAKLQVKDIHFIPMSALKGENVVARGESMPWFHGSPFLDHLETVHIAGDRNLIDLRFPVQYVQRPNLNFRGYSGTIASGIVRPGSEIVALPSGASSKVKSIVTYDGELSEAFAGMAVTMTLEDEIDISRGDTLVTPNNAPALDNNVEAMVVWMHEEPLRPGKSYLLKQGTVVTPALVSDVRYQVNVGNLHREETDGLELNGIGRVRVECSRPLAADPYSENRATGSFILIDRLTNATMAAGMIVERRTADETLARRHGAADAGTNVRLASKRQVARKDRIERSAEPYTVWITGLPRSGKSSIAYAVEKALFDAGQQIHVLDGEVLRLGVNRDLGFSGGDRWENQRRAAEMAKLFNAQGVSTIIALVSPLDAERDQARAIVGTDRFVGIFCDAPLDVCEARDEDGLYERARAGEITNVTGVDAPYERPSAADMVLNTVDDSLEDNVAKVLAYLRDRGLLQN